MAAPYLPPQQQMLGLLQPPATTLPPLESEAIGELVRTTDENAIVTHAVEKRNRLGFWDVSCLIINRMIGTGIFNSPMTVMQGTRSTGGALLLWFFAMFYGLAGAHVYIEYGLNVPRYVIDGREQAVPRSGGDLNYLQFVYRLVRYKKDTVLLSGCLFGISFICVGNMASNCISFGLRVLRAAHPDTEPSNGQVRGIALAAALFACFIHAVSRRGGIWLNNLLAMIKVGILFVILITTIVVLGGGFRERSGDPVANVFSQNMDPKIAFKPPAGTGVDAGTANGYAAAFLSIIFAYSGFDQANYVLGEIARPRRTFPRAVTFAVALVSVLYMLVNICYMAVVPAKDQSGDVVALLFFRKTFGVFGEGMADRIFNAFLALSSFGNIIVMTYTAARMKQEIAKQGFIPFRKFFGEDIDVSLGRLIAFLREKRGWKLRRLGPAEDHREATPVGALCLHFASCIVLVFATYGVKPNDAYSLLANLLAYLTTAWFGFFLALGILILRFGRAPDTEPAKTRAYREKMQGSRGSFDDVSERRTWQDMTAKSVYGWLSILCAVVYLAANAFPVVVSWVPATAGFTRSTVEWWVVPTVSWTILGFAALWWLGFVTKAKHRERHQHKRLVCEIWPEFEPADPNPVHSEGAAVAGDGGLVLVHESVLFIWEGVERDCFVTPAAAAAAAAPDGAGSLQQQDPWRQQGGNTYGGTRAPTGTAFVGNNFDGFTNRGPSAASAWRGTNDSRDGYRRNNAARTPSPEPLDDW